MFRYHIFNNITHHHNLPFSTVKVYLLCETDFLKMEIDYLEQDSRKCVCSYHCFASFYSCVADKNCCNSLISAPTYTFSFWIITRTCCLIQWRSLIKFFYVELEIFPKICKFWHKTLQLRWSNRTREHAVLYIYAFIIANILGFLFEIHVRRYFKSVFGTKRWIYSILLAF